MKLVNTIEELNQNLQTIEHYLSEGTEEEEEYASGLIFRGNCFVAYRIAGELRFAPSRFIGYKANNYKKHINSKTKDGRETNPVLDSLIKSKCTPNPVLEKEYFIYCNSLGIRPNRRKKDGKQRKFWFLDLGEEDFPQNLRGNEEFGEGRIVERAHKSRERNPMVIQIAKNNFKNKHGRLFCEVCGFDFAKEYGKLGEDFIEGHHTVPVSDMEPDHRTKPEEIAMVCSNCHRMLHKQRDGLSINKLKEIIKK